MKTESDKYTVRQVNADQQMVDTLLANNKGNRKVSPARVAQLVRDIRNGDWRPNGSTIVIDADGNLLDGQHRLLAIKEAGYPRYITLILVQLKERGEEAQTTYITMNSGRTGSAAQIFAHNGVKNGCLKTAICQQLCRIHRNMGASYIPTRAELVRMYNAMPELVNKAATMRDGPAIHFQAPAVAAFAAVAAGQTESDAQKVWDFARDVGLGANLAPGTAGHRLFVYCNAAGGKHVSTLHQTELFLRTLNAVYTHLDEPHRVIPSLKVRNGRPLLERVQREASAHGLLLFAPVEEKDKRKTA